MTKRYQLKTFSDSLNLNLYYCHRMSSDGLTTWTNIESNAKYFQNIEVVRELIEFIRQTESGPNQSFEIVCL